MERRSPYSTPHWRRSQTPRLPGGNHADGLEGLLAGKNVSVDEDLALPSASLIKVLVLAGLLRQADRDFLSLDEVLSVRPEDLVEDSKMLETEELPASVPVRRLAEGMITLNDNTATNLMGFSIRPCRKAA